MKKANKPLIVDLKKMPKNRSESHTLLNFVPDYERFKYSDNYVEEIKNNSLVDVIRMRAVMAAAYASYTSKKVKVCFNGELLKIAGIKDVAEMLFPNADKILCRLTPKIIKGPYKYTWEVCAVITNSSKYETNQLSNINGVVVKDGKHSKHLFNLLVDGVKEKIIKIFNDKNLKFSSSHVTSNIFLLINAKIPNPSWTGQRKDILDIDIRKLSEYVFDKKFITDLTEKLKNQIMDSILKESNKNLEKKKIGVLELDKIYIKANKAGSKNHSAKCVLLAVEGLSAMSQIKIGITNSLGSDYYGTLSLGGVIINARKECTVIETKTGNFIKQSTKLSKNIFMNVLSDITGLNMNFRYDPKSETYSREMSKLSYGSLIMCVDQDLDGKGNILGLLLSTFELFWPNLLTNGYVKWFCTPIIRAYPKHGEQIISHYSDLEYNNWAKINATDNYNIHYYKGLGTHDRDEVIEMFKSFHEHLYSYFMDEKSKEMFNIYFGTDPSLRKKELAQVTREPTTEETLKQELSKLISCTDHLRYETNLYQKDNLERKLDHIIDGQNQSSRKILDGCIKAFKNNNSKMKVSQLAGYVSKSENYHHGEASLSTSITNKAFVATGGKQLPFLVPLSSFGTRMCGGSDAAHPRYINTKLNKQLVDLIFPSIDYYMLEFNFDEGQRSEPKYFVPIIPMVIMESTEVPAHGWKLKMWGRDVNKVIDIIEVLIATNGKMKIPYIEPNTYKNSMYEWKGTFEHIRDGIYSMGKYELDGQIIHITELPLRVWTRPYITMLIKKQLDDPRIIASIKDASDDVVVSIKIKLKPGALDILDTYNDCCYTDGIQEYFQLRNRMDSHINLMGVDNAIISFDDYSECIMHWFNVRKEYYKKRIERQIAIINCNIKAHENIIRYINICNKFNLSTKEIDEINQILEENNFDETDKSLLQPKFTPVDKIEELYVGEKASYDYLLDLTDRLKSSRGLRSFEEKLIKIKNDKEELIELATRGHFPGSVLWKEELIKLRKVIYDGMKTRWKFGEAKRYKF
jgi:DNA topoisomerase-2